MGRGEELVGCSPLLQSEIKNTHRDFADTMLSDQNRYWGIFLCK
jgi:hypothetical protein